MMPHAALERFANACHFGLTYIRTRWFSHFADRKHLENYQKRKAQKHLSRVLRLSPYYKTLAAGVSVENWRNITVTDKAAMMAHFDEFNTRGLSKSQAFELALAAENSRLFSNKLKGVTIGLSSGTSGHRGLFLASDTESAQWAGVMLARALPRSLLQKSRIALFLRANSNLYERVQGRRIHFRFFDMLVAIPKHVTQLNEYAPDLLVGPPSVLRLLAKEKLEGRLFIQPEKIYSVAEVLEPLDKDYIENAFGLQLGQIYQATEGFLAITCIHGTLHFNEDHLIVEKEYLDSSHTRFYPIITDLSRITQPMVRYRLNDLLIERSTPCPCGSAFLAIERIEGRQDDIFTLPHRSTDITVQVFPDFIRRVVLEACSGIEEYLVEQLSKTEILFKLRLSPGTSMTQAQEQIRLRLSAMCDRLEVTCPGIRFEAYSEPLPTLAKLRRVVNRCRQESQN